MRTYKTVEQIETTVCDRCHKVIEANEHGSLRGGQILVDAAYGSRFHTLPREVKPNCCDDCFEWLLGEFGHKEL